MKKFLLVSVFVMSGCAHKTTEGLYDPGDTDITESDLLSHVEFLASDALEGRYPGTDGSYMAVKFIEQAFKMSGLKPYDESFYLQHFDFVNDIVYGPENILAVSGDDGVAVYDTGSFTPLGFSATGSFEGSVAFAGYGFSIDDSISWNDYAALDIENRWAIVLRGGPDDSPHGPFAQHMALRKKALVARDENALGLILVSSGGTDEDDLIRLRYDHGFGDAGIPVIHVKRSVARSWFETSGHDIDSLEKMLVESGAPGSFIPDGLSVSAAISLNKETVSIPNVIGVVPGYDSLLQDEYIVIGAHFDHLGYGGEGSSLTPDTVAVHNGADDNASGVAGMIELAEKFAHSDNRIKRSILFAAFNAEEKGSLGSRHLVDNFPVDLEQVVAMINLDMIGRLNEEVVNIGGTGTSPAFPGLLDSTNADYGFHLKMNPEGYGPSDHSNFYARDIPVLFFFTGTHSDYHKPSDDIETLNIAGEARLVNYIYEITALLGNEPERPVFTEAGPKEGMAPRARFKVTFGIIPAYASQVEGLEIDGTRSGGPADKAGMKRGDIIVAIDGKEIQNIYDYMYRLAELEAGKTVVVTVIRGDETLELTLIL